MGITSSAKAWIAPITLVKAASSPAVAATIPQVVSAAHALAARGVNRCARGRDLGPQVEQARNGGVEVRRGRPFRAQTVEQLVEALAVHAARVRAGRGSHAAGSSRQISTSSR